MHITVGIFGDQELAKKLGKKGTTNDIAIFNHSSSEGVFTYVCPNSDKIQALLQVLNMIDVPVIVVNALTKEIGEIIVGIDEMSFEKGVFCMNLFYQFYSLRRNISVSSPPIYRRCKQ